MYYQAEVFLTRQCNLNCPFCKVPKLRRPKTLSGEEWVEVFKMLKKVVKGIVVLFGGEPTLHPDIAYIIEGANNLNLPYTLITNSSMRGTVLNLIEEHGLRSLTVSLNSIKNPDVRDRMSLRLVEEILSRGLTVDLTVNIMFSRRNFREVPEMVKHFSDLGVNTIVASYEYGTEGFWMYRGPPVSNMVFKETDKPEVRRVIDELVRLKESGYRLWTPVEYLKALYLYSFGKRWHCSRLVNVIIDEDGSIMPCVDWRVGVERPYTWRDLPRKREIETWWKSVVKDCPGCIYDHQFIPEQVSAGKLKPSQLRTWGD